MSEILIVDDDPQGLYMLESLLKGHGHKVVTAVNGSDALDKARRHPPDLIISDFFMPTMDGFALCRECKNDDRLKDVPFIAYTATYTDPKDEELALSLGAARFLVKPIEPEVLLREVGQVLAAAQAGRLPPPPEPASEEHRLREYSQALIRKLEAKVAQFQGTTHALQEEMAQRRQAEQSLQESEEQYRSFFELAAVGMAQGDPGTGRLLRVNGRMCEITGFGPEELCSITVRDLTHPDDRAADWEKLQAMVQGRMPEYDNEKRYVRKDGRVVWVHVAARMIHDAAGKPLRTVAVIQDVTARRQAEDALKAMNVTLEERVAQRTAQLRALAAELTESEERERRKLAQTLHDGLQQLLVAAKMRVELLSGRVPGGSLHASIEQVDDLIAQSISTSRSLIADLSPPILYEAGLRSGLEWLSRWMKEKHGLTVHVGIDDQRIQHLPEDLRVFLFQAVREMLFNAAKHAGVDSACVGVRVVEDQRVQVVVEDRGMGFDPATLQEPKGGGGGFGLFSVRERLELLGGHLDVQSAPGQGTRVVLEVPLEHAARTPSPVEPERASAVAALREAVEAVTKPPPPRPKEGTAIRVLLADDHQIVREGLVSLLAEQPGIEVVGQAEDGLMAVEMAHDLKPDVVVMDLTMPRLDGIGATRRLKAELPGIKVIGLSMHGQSDMAQAMRQAGAVAYLSKGGPVEELVGAIQHCQAGAEEARGSCH